MIKNLACTLALAGLGALSASAEVVYNSIPSPLPSNLPSVGYEATSTAEFGALIAPDLSGGSTSLTTVTVAMSDWALKSTWDPSGTSTGFNIPLTLQLYQVGAGNTVGADLGSAVTVNAFIAWRPEADPTNCGVGTTQYKGADGACVNGSLSTVTFDFTGQGITLPNQLIYGLAYNTTDHGYNPTGVPGPNESLNFGLSDVAPTVGSNPLPDTAYFNSTWAGFYTDGGAGGTGTFRQDTGWAPYSGSVEFEATPEPATFGLIGLGLAGLVAAARKKALRG